MNVRGFSLIEVIIASFLTGLLLMMVHNLVLGASRSANSVESKTEFTSLVQTLDLLLKNEKTCHTVLFNSRLESTLQRPLFHPEKNDVASEDLLQAIRSYQTQLVTIGESRHGYTVTALKLKELDPTQRVTESETKTRYLASLRLEATKAAPLTVLSHDFVLWVTTENHRITSCFGSIPERVVASEFRDVEINMGLSAGRLSVHKYEASPLADALSDNVYLLPFRGNLIPLFDSTTRKWRYSSIPPTGVAGSPEIMKAETNYDVFAVAGNNGELRSLYFEKWADNQNRVQPLKILDGVEVHSIQESKRYLGTVRTNTDAKFEDSEKRRFVWNRNNRLKRTLHVTDPTTLWSYTTNKWRPANNNLANRVEVVIGLTDSFIDLTLTSIVSNMGGYGIYVYLGICEDCTNTLSSQIGYFFSLDGFAQKVHSELAKTPSIGYHFYQWTETVNTTYSYPHIYGASNGGIRGTIEN